MAGLNTGPGSSPALRPPPSALRRPVAEPYGPSRAERSGMAATPEPLELEPPLR
jgi:hypothetical protein